VGAARGCGNLTAAADRIISKEASDVSTIALRLTPARSVAAGLPPPARRALRPPDEEG
jgi:hypothetical protein